MSETALRVAVGDDDVLLREGIVRILDAAGMDVVGEAGDAEDLLRKVSAFQPDVAIIDVRMPPKREDDGMQAALRIRTELPATGVLMLSQYLEPSLAVKLIGERAEGVGYLLKERIGDVDSFLDAIRRVADGGTALDSEVVARVLGRRSGKQPLAALNDRELSVLAEMAAGQSNNGIAQQLFMSQASVEKHITAIFRKLDIPATETAHRRVLAVLTYLERGVRD